MHKETVFDYQKTNYSCVTVESLNHFYRVAQNKLDYPN